MPRFYIERSHLTKFRNFYKNYIHPTLLPSLAFFFTNQLVVLTKKKYENNFQQILEA